MTSRASCNVTLRRFVAEDAARIFALSQEPGYREWLPSQVYADEAAARAALEFLKERNDKAAAVRDLLWALMTSAEFLTMP